MKTVAFKAVKIGDRIKNPNYNGENVPYTKITDNLVKQKERGDYKHMIATQEVEAWR